MKTQKRNYRKKVDTYVTIVDKEKLDKVDIKRLEALVIIDQHLHVHGAVDRHVGKPRGPSHSMQP